MILPAIHATISCVFENKPINCTNNMVTGTLVYSRCDPQFHYDRLLNYSQMTCQKNGKYDVILGDCVPGTDFCYFFNVSYFLKKKKSYNNK